MAAVSRQKGYASKISSITMASGSREKKRHLFRAVKVAQKSVRVNSDRPGHWKLSPCLSRNSCPAAQRRRWRSVDQLRSDRLINRGAAAIDMVRRACVFFSCPLRKIFLACATDELLFSPSCYTRGYAQLQTKTAIEYEVDCKYCTHP